jgi:signal transduction histidine kinase
MRWRGLVPWAVATAVAAFGAWVEVGSEAGWRWSDLLAGVIVAVVGAVLWSVGRVQAGLAMFAVAGAWFVGTWAVRLDLDRDVVDRLLYVHRPALLIAIAIVSAVRVRSRSWVWFLVAASAGVTGFWFAEPPKTAGFGSALMVAALAVVCRAATRPTDEIRWWLPWLPMLAWAGFLGEHVARRAVVPTYYLAFAATAGLAAVVGSLSWARPERALAIDLGLVDRRRGDVRLTIVTTADSPETLAESPTRTVLLLDATTLLAVDHPAGVSFPPSLVSELRRTGSLMAAHRRLSVDLQERTAAVAVSRERLARATDHERERFQRDVLTTVAPSLDRLGAQFPPDAGTVGRLVSEASREVAQLAAGGDPAALSDGLAAAIQGLAASCPVPVDVTFGATNTTAAQDRLAWFVVAETVANAVRHSGASRVTIDVGQEAGELAVRVSDDGCGGVDDSAGSGVAGLRRRAEAAGAKLSVTSRVGAGTVVELSIPGHQNCVPY